jgi:hypothetical protein
METTIAESIRVHVFETAGLGKAPYRFVGNERSIFQAVPGDPNCPIQPGSSCDFCGQAIMDVYWLKGSDGRRFKVGCDCIGRAGDSGLKRAIAPAIRKANHERADARIAAAKLLLTEDVRAKLATMPHPIVPAQTDKNLLGYVDWCFKCAGRAGKIKVARIIEGLAK